MTHCCICHRNLSNPVSMKIGMGPVCRARENMQGVFEFMRAQFDVLKHEHGKYIFIRDVGHNTGRSVTNDVEYVIERLYYDHGIWDETRIFYEDSEGGIDEILHTALRFTGFKPGHTGVEL